jgi:hypothetical protein
MLFVSRVGLVEVFRLQHHNHGLLTISITVIFFKNYDSGKAAGHESVRCRSCEDGTSFYLPAFAVYS